MKLEFENIERKFGESKNADWSDAIELGEQILNNLSNDVSIYIRSLYMFHNILVEENYSEIESKKIELILMNLFTNSFERFKNNADYQFYIGKILFISEWYFGINDDLKPINHRLAFKMQERAYELYPNKKLYKWAYLFSLGDKKASFLAEELVSDSYVIKELNSFGFPGKYIFQSIKNSLIRQP